MRRRPWRVLAAALAAGLVALNALAYRHARALTHFTVAGARTPRPEALSPAQKLRVLVTGPTLPRPRDGRTPAELGLAFEPRGLETADGLRLAGWFVPRQDALGTLLLFHGYADSKASLLAAALAVHELGYAGLLVDFRGSGGSQGDSTSIGYHEAEDVVAALRHARAGGAPPPLVLYGASMGAAAVMRAVAELHAAPEGVILQHPFSRMRVTIARRFEKMGLPAFPAADLLVFWGGWQQGFDGFRHNPVDYAPALRVPALLLQGDRDDRVSLAEAQAIFERLGGRKQLQVFKGLGHESFAEARPAEWKRVVGAYLGSLRRGPAGAS